MSCPCEKIKREMPKCEGGTPPVLEINSVEAPVLFHTITIPASIGDETTIPPTPGAYRNARVFYEADNVSYLYDSDGIPQVLSDGVARVTSVNGQTGNVVLSAADLGAQEKLTAGTSITISNRNVISAPPVDTVLNKTSPNPISNSAVATAIDTITTELDRTVVYDLEMDADAESVSFTEDKVDVVTGVTSKEVDTIPTASATSAGTISAADFRSITYSQERLDALENGSVAIANLPASPSQTNLTNAWLNATGYDELINRASIFDITNSKVWTYYTNILLWEETPAGAVTVNPFTNSTAGTILGSNVDGNISANVDGTGSVAGWSTLVGLVNTKGEGDMKKSTYDTNNNGIVDNSEKVNNHTVNDDVPANVFSGQATGTASGTELTISNPIMIDDVELKGDTQQQTYSGKNLAKTTDCNISGAGYTMQIANGYVEISAQSSNSAFDICGGTRLGEWLPTYSSAPDYHLTGADGGTYILKFFDTTGTSITGTANGILRVCTNQRQVDKVIWSSGYYDTATITLNQGEYIKDIIVWTNGANSSVILKFKPQIEKGSTATSYEPYVGGTASPNPDYPQEVKTVTGRQVVTVADRNLFDKDKSLENVYIDASGNWVTGGGYSYVNQEIATTGGEKITLSFSQQVGSGYIRFAQYKSDGTFIQRDLFNTSPTTITLQADTAKVIWSVDNTDSIYFENLQIERGASATPYVPYNTQTYEVNLGKNLFDKDNANVVHKAPASSGNSLSTNSYYYSVYLPAIEGATYTFSDSSSSLDQYAKFFFLSEDPTTATTFLTQQTRQSGSQSVTATAPSGAKYLCVYLAYTTTQSVIDDLLASLQIEKGSTATTYAPYFTPIELCKIGDYQDYIYKSGDDWYVHKDINKVLLDGTQYVTQYGTATANKSRFTCSVYGAADVSPDVIVNMSDKFVGVTRGDTWNNKNGVYQLSGGIGFYWEAIAGYTREQVQTWLSTNNVIAYYLLATPTDTKITDNTLIGQLNDLMKAGLYDTTEITVDGSLPAILNVTYFNKNLNGVCGAIKKLAANS